MCTLVTVHISMHLYYRYSHRVSRNILLLGKSTKTNSQNFELCAGTWLEMDGLLEYQQMQVGKYIIKTFSKCRDTKRMDALLSYKTSYCERQKYGFVSKILQHKDQSVSLIIIPTKPEEMQITGSVTGSTTPQVLRMRAPKSVYINYILC